MKRLRKLEGIVEELSGQIEVDTGSGRHHSSSGESPEAGGVHPEPQRSSSLGGSSTHDHHSPSLDQVVHKESGGPGQVDPGSENPRGASAGRQSSSSLHRSFGRLVLNDKGKSRYVSNAFWSKLNDEVSCISSGVVWLVIEWH